MGWGLGWTDVIIAAAFYVVSGLGITVGSTAISATARSRPTGR